MLSRWGALASTPRSKSASCFALFFPSITRSYKSFVSDAIPFPTHPFRRWSNNAQTMTRTLGRAQLAEMVKFPKVVRLRTQQAPTPAILTKSSVPDHSMIISTAGRRPSARRKDHAWCALEEHAILTITLVTALSCAVSVSNSRNGPVLIPPRATRHLGSLRTLGLRLAPRPLPPLPPQSTLNLAPHLPPQGPSARRLSQRRTTRAMSSTMRERPMGPCTVSMVNLTPVLPTRPHPAVMLP